MATAEALSPDWFNWLNKGNPTSGLKPLVPTDPAYAQWAQGGGLAAQGTYNTGAADPNYRPPEIYNQQAAPPTPLVAGLAGWGKAFQGAVTNPPPPIKPGNSTLYPSEQDYGRPSGGAFPVYNAAQGIDRYATASPTPETPEGRIERWTQDNMRQYGMSHDQAKWAAFARLKRDYERTNTDWHRSGFDLSGVQSLATEAPNAQTNYGPGGGTTPTAQQGGGTRGAVTDGAVPQTGGGGQPFLDEATVDMVRSNADQALSAIRGARSGGERDRSGPVGKYRESLMARTLQAYLSMFGVGGATGDGPVQDANAGIAELVRRQQGGQGIGDLVRERAARMMHGIDFSNMDNSQILDILNLAGGAGTLGYSPLAQYEMENSLGDMADRANLQGQRGEDPQHAALASAGGRGRFDDILARFLAAQQGR